MARGRRCIWGSRDRGLWPPRGAPGSCAPAAASRLSREPPGRPGPGGSAERGRGGRVRAHRALSASAQAHRSSKGKIAVHFVNRDGVTLTAKGRIGDSLPDVVVENNLDIDGFGAFEGTLACSTCHLIFEDHIFEKLEAVTDEENDMLDLAYGLTDPGWAAKPV
ncbi:Adrenodoxin, mitochondrial [Manis javanica]|nr:Adrenodoxin, mitochondrial [Manis javanica]